MEAESIYLPPPPVFCGENYEYWSIRMRVFLQAYDLWNIVESGLQQPQEGEQGQLSPERQRMLKKEAIKSAKALAFIHSTVSDSIFLRIIEATTAKEAWDTLEEEFLGSWRVRQIKLRNLRIEFENARMKEDEAVEDYTSRLTTIVNMLDFYGEVISDQRVVEKVLISLPTRFNPVVVAVEQAKDLSKLSLIELLGSVQAHELRINIREESTREGAFKGKATHKKQSYDKGGRSAGKFPPCNVCKRTNHLEKDCWWKG